MTWRQPKLCNTQLQKYTFNIIEPHSLIVSYGYYIKCQEFSFSPSIAAQACQRSNRNFPKSQNIRQFKIFCKYFVENIENLDTQVGGVSKNSFKGQCTVYTYRKNSVDAAQFAFLFLISRCELMGTFGIGIVGPLILIL